MSRVREDSRGKREAEQRIAMVEVESEGRALALEGCPVCTSERTVGVLLY